MNIVIIIIINVIILPVLNWEHATIHATQREQQTVRKLHLHLHSWCKKKKKGRKKIHANLNETVSFVAVIEKPFFVNYCFSKALSAVTELKQKNSY